MYFFLTLFLVNIFCAIIIKIFYKLTTGICKCSRHLEGKVIIVTDGHEGIGFATAKDLAERGARVILACSDHTKANAACNDIIALTGNKNVEYKQLDLASFASVRNFADNIIRTEKRLDVLINNAAVYDVDNLKTDDGLSLAMQTNHFGPFLLTSLLLPLLKSSAPSRIINVTSSSYLHGKIDFENLNNERETNDTYSVNKVYKNTKMCNVLMTLELARRLKGAEVTSNCSYPGIVTTDISLMLKNSWTRHLMPLLAHFFKTPWEGAQTTIFMAVSPEVEGVTGKYYADCRERNISEYAQNEEVARKLWKLSEKIVGIKE